MSFDVISSNISNRVFHWHIQAPRKEYDEEYDATRIRRGAEFFFFWTKFEVFG